MISLCLSFDDDYENRALAVSQKTLMRIKSDITYADLGLCQPEGGIEVGAPMTKGNDIRSPPSRRCV